ncbi:cobalt ABC transporter [Propionimicrobium lymphophilum]|uniref:cobalt ABC transporter n=1 Tax=Propionimicrobium lymphophilum TaxID=33012 RepID=UPI0023F29210|nr:cobalt ABC transporter [Propionimicrobium lymphophilum]
MPPELVLPTDFETLVTMMCSVDSPRPVFLLDGGSGAGKSRLSGLLMPRLKERFPGIELLALDSFYQGWDGVFEAARHLVDGILTSPNPGYRTWDWHESEPGEWVSLRPGVPLLVEGCGAITRRSVELADLSIWLERPEEDRKRFALARDGDTFAPWWDRWAANERKLREKNPPSQLADVKVTFS